MNFCVLCVLRKPVKRMYYAQNQVCAINVNTLMPSACLVSMDLRFEGFEGIPLDISTWNCFPAN